MDIYRLYRDDFLQRESNVIIMVTWPAFNYVIKHN